MRDRNVPIPPVPEPVVSTALPPLPRTPTFVAGLVIVYVVTVLLVDTLALLGPRFGGVNWQVFQWSPADLHALLQQWGVKSNALGFLRNPTLQAFDLFKCTMWFLVPFLLCLPWMDWKFLGFRKWSRWDLTIFIGLSVVCVAAVGLVGVIPGLRQYYPGFGTDPWHIRVEFLTRNVLWLASWLIGWEFMHRYFLLRAVAGRWPAWGWLLLPIFEGLYHVVKHPLEMLGMVVLSFVVTLWTLKRRNFLLPFLVHLVIELALVLYLFFF